MPRAPRQCPAGTSHSAPPNRAHEARPRSVPDRARGMGEARDPSPEARRHARSGHKPYVTRRGVTVRRSASTWHRRGTSASERRTLQLLAVKNGLPHERASAAADEAEPVVDAMPVQVETSYSNLGLRNRGDAKEDVDCAARRRQVERPVMKLATSAPPSTSKRRSDLADL
jgi:hypothetical protein